MVAMGGTVKPRILVLKNFRIVDEASDFKGSVLVEGGRIKKICTDKAAGGSGPGDRDPGLGDAEIEQALGRADMVIDGGESAGKQGLTLMPAFVDLHAHFRDPFCRGARVPEKETLESASLAAAAGGYGTVVCMANTDPVIDTIDKAAVLQERAAALGLIDLYPVLSLTRGMEGRELSEITELPSANLPPKNPPALKAGPGPDGPGARTCGPVRLLSEDGKDPADDGLFLAALAEGRRTGLPLSCHCDAGGPEAERAKRRGEPRAVWSRIEENNAVRRALDLAARAGAKIHIAHVSTREAMEMIGELKTAHAAGRAAAAPGFSLSCEVSPHHIACTEDDARRLGEGSFGRVNPPLRDDADRRALAAAIAGGLVDAIATDHAPHTESDKAAGAPGFTGLETAFAVCYTTLVRPPAAGAGQAPVLSLSRLSALMSAGPSRILGLAGNRGSFGLAPPEMAPPETAPPEGGLPLPRGRIVEGWKADFCIADLNAPWIVDPRDFMSRGKNSPFAGRELWGKIILTIRNGKVVYQR
ncbi:MAG: amidohydrolase family protein [Spirochaetaceae bacterium]|jgi:dihydroorotase|nr:amidohydrolase family protein [Spirochaetaceae bacterium]